MTILSRIRSRVGLLVGIIFLALLAFVLTDLFNSQRGLFGGTSSADNSVGEINGHTVTLNEFREKMDDYSQGKNLTEAEQSKLSDGIWQELLDKYIYEPQYEALGLTVTLEELEDQMYGEHPSSYMNQFFQDPQTGQISDKYAAPDGGLNGKAIAKLVKDMTADQEKQWTQIETEMTKFLLHQKYVTLIKNGFYVTTSEANHEYNDENTKYTFKFIEKKFTDIPDSTIKCTDAELMEYYNANQYKFKQADNVRSMDYVSFDIHATANDIAAQRTDMTNLMKDYKAKKGADDSIYVASMTESGMYEKKYLHPGQFPVGSDSAFIKAANGDVLGPFNTGENISIYKVIGQKSSMDSARVRHILIAYKGAERAGPEITRTDAQAKIKADSLLRVIKGGKTKMEDLVEKFTDDPGSKPGQQGPGNKGDYGWFSEESGFVQEFKDAGFKNPKGATIVVKTAFGYHVIQVLDQSTVSTKVQVESIEKKVEPSEATIRDVYNKASEFAGRNNTGDAFTDAVKKTGMNLLKTDLVQENAKQISGIETPREIIRWMFDDKSTVGTISQPFQSGDRYLVCRLSKILNKGTKPFDEQTVKDICTVEVRKQKKAEMLLAEVNKAKAPTLDQWAANAKLSVMPGVNVTFGSPYIQNAGFEPAVVGTLANMTPNQTSAPIKGTSGIYVVMLESVQKPAPITDVPAQKTKVLTNLTSRAESGSADVLKDKANVIDNRFKHY
jgi:peptidyl-prolyl cis-trans isomerase D